MRVSQSRRMTAVLRKFLPVGPPSPEIDDDSVEYSFAMEYCGPPVSYDIPRVFPIDVGHAPVAAAVDAASMADDLSVPVIQPIVKADPLSKKLSKDSNDSKLGLKPSLSVNLENPLEKRSRDGHGQPSEQIDSSEALASGGRRTPVLMDAAESSGTSCFSDSRGNSNESSDRSGMLKLPEDCTERLGYQHYLNPTNWDSTESAPSSLVLSSEISSSCDGEGLSSESHCNVRTAVVTFREPESSEESGRIEAGIGHQAQGREKAVRRGSCYRCLKGNRFTKKEACIVCNAKYCGNCVLRAMGSMPEGRKCITCIGYPVKVSKRGSLGKKTRLLRQLFTGLEIKQILKSEVVCEANCLPAELVLVNGKPLCQEEMVLLQKCPNPPKKLKPGNYWYDKVSGLWGKEGKKPCQIITPQLNVGDQIKRDASNGKTNVLINNREITKAEVFMLKSAGVQCTGYTSFWVSADGSCQEEGHRNVKGPIWEKTGTKIVCAALFLPIPPELENPSKGSLKTPIDGVVPGYLERRALHKLLLVGYNRSGTSNLYKQAKILYNIPFSEDERQNIKLIIQSKLYAYLGVLLEGRERFEKESLIKMGKRQAIDRSGPSGSTTDQIDDTTIYSIGPRHRLFSDWLLKAIASGNLDAIFPAATREYAQFVEDLWKDAAIQATYKRRNELQMLSRAADYFLDRAAEISRTDYEPSDMDILHAEGMTSSNALTSMEFSYPQSVDDDSMDRLYQHDPQSRYQLIRAHPKNLGENCKWLGMFADTEVVLFSVSLTDYDQFMDDSEGVPTNKLLLSRNLFESVVSHPTFSQTNFLLILNKFDLLKEIIGQAPLARCDWLNDFNPVISIHHNNNGSNNGNGGCNPSLAQQASHYIASKFKRLFYTLTRRKLYVSIVSGVEPSSVDEALRYAREILRWDEEKPSFSANEWSSCSIDVSSS